MAPFDLLSSLKDLSDDAPTGPNLELDPDFGALDRAAEGKPEKQYGATIIPAEDPDWKEVVSLAEALLLRTHDLRVLSHLAVARLHLDGLAAFVEVLTQIRSLLELRWETVHPQLDPEDENDPTLRANALLRLCEPVRVLRVLRLMPLAASPRGGAVSWRDVALATGAIEAEPGMTVPAEASIRGVFHDTDRSRLEVLLAVSSAGAKAATFIPAAFDNQAGHGTGPEFSDLIKALREIERAIARYMPEIVAEPTTEPRSPDALNAEAGAARAESASAAAPRPSTNPTISGIAAIETREDAVRALDLARGYFERHEPSSPLPLLIDRARRLAEMNFLEILRDLAPDGLGQAQTVVQARDA